MQGYRRAATHACAREALQLRRGERVVGRMLLPSQPLAFDPNPAKSHRCKVSGHNRILGCRRVDGGRCASVEDFAWGLDLGVVACAYCGADVTAALPLAAWAEMLAPSSPALPSPNARANELRAAAVRDIAGVREWLADDRPLKASECADEVAWDALDAIAAGCDDPAGLARDLAALRDEVRAAQR